MLFLSLLQQWVWLWEVLSIQSLLPGGTSCLCWWFPLTCHPSHTFANMLSYLALPSLVSSSMLHPNLTHMVSFFMLDTICSLCHPRSLTDHDWVVYSLGVFSASLCPISPHTCIWCLHSSTLLSHQTYISACNIITVESSNCGGTLCRQNKGKQINCRFLAIRKKCGS